MCVGVEINLCMAFKRYITSPENSLFSVTQADSKMSGSIQEEDDLPANHTGQGHKSDAITKMTVKYHIFFNFVGIFYSVLLCLQVQRA